MLKLTFLVMGQLSEPHWKDACAEYKKRLSRTCTVQEIELKEAKTGKDPSPGEIRAALEKEADEILSRIPTRAFTVALCIDGKQYDSPALSALFAEKTAAGVGELCFIIGSSHGLAESLKQRADLRLSMSKMTFPHELFRVMLCEQLYRASEINAGSKYHK